MTRKIFLTLFMILALSSVSCGSSSDDIYVRKDVLEAIVKSIDTKFDAIMKDMKEIKEDLKEVRAELKTRGEEITILRQEIAAVKQDVAVVSAKVEGLDKSMDNFRQDIYLFILILGLMAAYPAVKEFFKWRDERNSLKLDDVKDLIKEAMEENNAMLIRKIQGGMNQQ